MKILHTSDWHIGNYPGPEENGINLRGQDILNCLNFMIQAANAIQPDAIVVSGDIFHAAKVWSDRGLEETRQAIEIIERLGYIAPTIVLRGTPNHDGEEQFEMLKTHFETNNAVSIVTEPQVVNVATDIDAFHISKLQVACLPGFDRGVYRAKYPGLSKEDENRVFTEELGKSVLGLRAQCNDNEPKIFISHYTVPGCNTESGQVQFLAQFEPVILPEILDATDFDLVALGHIHRPQQVPSCKKTYYSGAINALNFNDEGQERGFWIHDLDAETHEFIKTPSREFITFKFTDTDITGINTNELDNVAFNWWGHNDGVRNKIVRIQYTCTDENNKALNKALIEKRLYTDGAFYVHEIAPEKITISANKNELSEKNAPEDNLRDYFVEKAVPDEKIVDLIEVARPIIQEATANNITASLTGMFIPIEIEVKNYRNYIEEKFNFDDITFCTINGANGAGKSSIFMDAILDCLYEEPREGDLTGWINNSESARSGSIKFTFKIGEQIFRVTRTRTKSGKGTLNLAELVDDEWVNRSKERMGETQSAIINILGMDSLTFRSCALIMQDQYGLFLQADKESRMTILGNILGLGIYGDMEAIAKDKYTEINRQIRQNNDEVEKLSGNLPNEEEINTNITSNKSLIEEKETQINSITKDADSIKLRLNSKVEAATRALKLSEGINTLNMKKSATEANKQAQENILNATNIILSQEQNILTGVEKYNQLLVKEKELLQNKALYDSKSNECNKLMIDVSNAEKEINSLQNELSNLKNKKVPFVAKIAQEEVLKSKNDNYLLEKLELSKLEEKSNEYIRLKNELSIAERTQSKLVTSYKEEHARRTAEYKGFQEKTLLLNNSNCIDPANAKCKFLADAQEANAKLIPYKTNTQKWIAEQKILIDEAQNKVNLLSEQIKNLNFNQEIIKQKRSSLVWLEQSSKEYEAIAAYKEQIKMIDESIGSLNLKLIEKNENLFNLKKEHELAVKELDSMKNAADEYNNLVLEISMNKSWLEKEKQLPVAKEKKTIAETRITELDTELLDIATELIGKQQELDTENQTAIGSDLLQAQLSELENNISNHQNEIQRLSMEIGAYNKQLEQIAESKLEISRLQKLINQLSEKAALYEELKKAFSQDGVPHNIIKSIVPVFEAIANNILGQMSGGKMSMEFVTEKVLKSNSKKEVVTLDIIINDGVGRLPYLSKSGGERVKSSLSVILALAEIKSSRAGIQLGMLFIDEPPFLDSEGIQAYCDALQTIQSRYSDLKIMAITHDPTMKARFPQSLDVVKTDDGSKILFN